MKKEQPMINAFLEEVMIFLAIVGISTILWAVEGNHTNFWREVSKSTMLGYVIRFIAGAVTRQRGNPLLPFFQKQRAD